MPRNEHDANLALAARHSTPSWQVPAPRRPRPAPPSMVAYVATVCSAGICTMVRVIFAS